MISVIVLVGGGFFLFQHFTASAQNKTNQPSIDEITKSLTVDTDEMTTNLKSSNHFIKVQFKIQVSNQKTKDEVNKRMFQVKNAIIYELSGMDPNQLQGPKGLNLLETSLKNRLNEILLKGHVTRVYTTDILIQ